MVAAVPGGGLCWVLSEGHLSVLCRQLLVWGIGVRSSVSVAVKSEGREADTEGFTRGEAAKFIKYPLIPGPDCTWAEEWGMWVLGATLASGEQSGAARGRQITCPPTTRVYGEPALYLARGTEGPIRYTLARKEFMVPLDQAVLQ